MLESDSKTHFKVTFNITLKGPTTDNNNLIELTAATWIFSLDTNTKTQAIIIEHHSTWSSYCTATTLETMFPSSFYVCHEWCQVFSYECQSVLYPSTTNTQNQMFKLQNTFNRQIALYIWLNKLYPDIHNIHGFESINIHFYRWRVITATVSSQLASICHRLNERVMPKIDSWKILSKL